MSETVKVISAVHGIAPRSDELLRLGGDVERGRAEAGDYEALLEAESAAWLDAQREAGIDVPSDAKLDWQDHLRPIVKAAHGFADDVDNAPVTRWFKTNTFYRQPTIEGRLSLDASELPKLEGSHIDLLAPHTFAKLCADDPEGGIGELVEELYSEIVEQYAGRGVSSILFTEYAARPLAFVISQGFEPVKRLAEDNPDTSFGYLQHGNFEIPLDLPSNLGVTASRRSLKSLASIDFEGLAGRDVWVPAVEADTTRAAESAVRDWDARITTLGLSRIVLTNNVDFQHIPLPYAYEKIKWLAEEVSQINQKLGA